MEYSSSTKQLTTIFSRAIRNGRIQQSQVQQAVVKTGRKTAEFEEAPERRQFCKWPCKCSRKPLCLPGVSLVTDGCGCCKTCAKQFGELCTEADTCDPHKDLYCDYSGDRPKYEFGICAYTLGVGCRLNGIHYRHGQTFQPHCHYKCTCVNGAFGCTPTCTKKLAADQCRNPKAIEKSEYCCEKSICNRSAVQQAATYRVMSAYSARPVIWRKKCLLQTTPWSLCSKSCDIGISVRVTNDNSKCELERESRLCFTRPCDTRVSKNMKKGKKCLQTFQHPKPEKFALSGCTSRRSYRPIFCGTCSDSRCCVPNKEKTVKVEFNCTDGEIIMWKMMWITSCKCQQACIDSEDIFSDLKLL
ncbi:cellular communication network factor 6 [Carcharodon carcharias]|uniref:cellular communication network factor 6 n=1 Tax=Carcharodon carcharias TaxID=13397 RepID=UPI001B7ECAF2|nr:cellular communication network factor 6 [Carcharodon carcharias]